MGGGGGGGGGGASPRAAVMAGAGAALRGTAGLGVAATAAAAAAGLSVTGTGDWLGGLWPAARAERAPDVGTAARADERSFPPDTAAGPVAGPEEAAFEEWLRKRGAKGLEQVCVGHVGEEGGGSAVGRGLFCRADVRGSLRDGLRWRPWRPALRVSFPLSNVLTPAACLREPRVGWVYRSLLEDGTLNPQLAVMAFLVVERLRGDQSPWAPYIAVLPCEEALGTPLFFSESELQMLSGTALHEAVLSRQKALRKDFSRVKRAATDALRACKGGERGSAPPRAPSFDDFLWANGVYWSRVLELPLARGRSTLPGEGSSEGDAIAGLPETRGGIVTVEGLCPGLDCCNHGESAPGQWRVAEQTPAVQGPPSEKWLGIPRKWLPSILGFSDWGVETFAAPPPDAPCGFLELTASRALRPGDEIRIDYGARSNAELLFTYGFVDPHNTHDTLVLSAPMTNKDLENPVNQARMELMHAKGMRPQVFLPLSGISAHGDGGHQPITAKEFPSDVIEMMEVMVMSPKELAAELEGLEKAEVSAAAGSRSGAMKGKDLKEPSFAALTLLVRLMQLQVYNLEGPGGTGSLEHDTALMLKHLMAEKDGEGASEYAGSPLSRNAYHALVYRMNQKRIARAYLALAERMLSYHLPAKGGILKPGFRPYRP